MRECETSFNLAQTNGNGNKCTHFGQTFPVNEREVSVRAIRCSGVLLCVWLLSPDVLRDQWEMLTW